jgi:two-component system response regulator DevR
MTAQIKVMLVDDHQIVLKGLIAVLQPVMGIKVVGQAATQQKAVEVARECKPDVILMDVRLPDGSGIEACREILEFNPQIKVLMLTSYPDDEAVFASIMAGACGYILKEVSTSGIIDAIKTIVNGGSLLDPSVTGKIMEKLRHHPSEAESRMANLNDKERIILDLIAEGKTNKEIGKNIYLSEKTIKNYVSSILSKLQLGRRSAAAAFITEFKH